MNKVYISCPANFYTGGPTLAHQLCYTLRQNGVDAYMWYFGSKKFLRSNNPVHKFYKSFNNPYVMEAPQDIKANVIVAVETNVSVLLKYRNAQKMIWWMSVDNYFLVMSSFLSTVKTRFFNFKPSMEYCKRFWKKKRYQVIYNKDIVHLVQSEYARQFLIGEKVAPEMIKDLSDYLEDEVLKINIDTTIERDEKTVLYNPKKGIEFTQKLMQELPDLNWKPIVNMTKQDVIDTLCRAELYIDFGNHPGKDRFPREAVLCGCCIITGTNGSAANDVDIPISRSYKFDAIDSNLSVISQKIRFVLNNYQSCIKDFEAYKRKILDEKQVFLQQALNIFRIK